VLGATDIDSGMNHNMPNNRIEHDVVKRCVLSHAPHPLR
jgi:hypothetical protein